MFVRITWGAVKDGTWDDFEAAYKQSADEAGAVEGLVSRMLVRDQENPNEGFTISTWESRQAMEDYEENQRRMTMMPAVQPYFTGEWKTHHCEVRHTKET